MQFEVSTLSFNLNKDEENLYESIKIIIKNPYNQNYVVVLYIKVPKEEETSKLTQKVQQHKPKLTISLLKKYISKYCVSNPPEEQIDLIYMGKMCGDETKLDDLQSFNGRYMMHMLFKEKFKYAKSLTGFMDASNIYRSSDNESKSRTSYHEEELRLTDDDVEAKLEYSPEQHREYSQRYAKYQRAYYQTYGVYFPAERYRFEDYMREESEKTTTTKKSFMPNEIKSEPISINLIGNQINNENDLNHAERNPAGNENDPNHAEGDHADNENEAEPVEEEINQEDLLNLIWDYIKYILHYSIIIYVLISNIIGFIFDEDVPVVVIYLCVTAFVALGTAHSITFIIDKSIYLSMHELVMRFGIGLIASLYPEWKAYEIKPNENEQQELINREE
jgi:hypothetical protein